MAKGPIQLQQLGTQMYVTLKGFNEQRYTGQVQFHITMNQGGVSRAVMLTQAAFGYDRDYADQVATEVAQATAQPPPQPEEVQYGTPKAPPITLIATMSKKE